MTSISLDIANQTAFWYIDSEMKRHVYCYLEYLSNPWEPVQKLRLGSADIGWIGFLP